MKITIELDMLKPATLAALIDDLYEQPGIAKLIDALEESVGVEESIDFLIDAGVNANLAVALFE